MRDIEIEQISELEAAQALGHLLLEALDGVVLELEDEPALAADEVIVVAFAVGVVASSPPNDNASNAKWMADYTKSHAVGHIVSGVSLLVSGLCFLVFVLGLWQRIAARGTRPNPLPLIGAAVTAACMATGGVFMAMPGVIVLLPAPICTAP